SNGGSGGAVINLVIGGDAARDVGFGHVKGSAERAGQAGAAGTQLLGGAGHADLQSGEGDDAVASASADIERGRAQERAGAGADIEAHHFADAQADSGVVAESVTSFEHRLRAQGRAVGGRAGLSDENQLGGGGGADGNSAGVGAAHSRSAEADGDIGGDVVGQVGESGHAIGSGHGQRALQGPAAIAAR